MLQRPGFADARAAPAGRAGWSLTRLPLALALCVLADPALAGGLLPIEGVYGNADGCHFYATGEVRGALMILTPDSLSSPEAQCDFIALGDVAEGSFTIAATCSGSGDFAANPDEVVVTEGGAAGYFVTVKGLPELGPFIPCTNFPGGARA